MRTETKTRKKDSVAKRLARIEDERIARLPYPPQREQHGRVDLAMDRDAARPLAIRDEHTGEIGTPYRADGILAAMHRAGTISGTQCRAGERFSRDFHAAHHLAIKAADMSRPIVDGRPQHEFGLAVYRARDRVWAALDHVGGINSLSGSCLWHVVGCDVSLSTWAMVIHDQRVAQRAASGILQSILDSLAAHYRISDMYRHKSHEIRRNAGA